MSAFGQSFQKKYFVSAQEARCAFAILLEFFEEKTESFQRKVVLPQVADWAWHEMILNTRRYERMCSELFGRFLNHIKEDPADVAVCDVSTLDNRMIQPESVALTSRLRWSDSGYDSPAYRFNISESPSRIAESFVEAIDDSYDEEPDSRWRFEWLVERLAQRFEIEIEVANSVVSVYSKLFTSRLFALDSFTAEYLPSPVLWAWQEHVLSTARYRTDCRDVHGTFLHHSPPTRRAFFGNTRLVPRIGAFLTHAAMQRRERLS